MKNSLIWTTWLLLSLTLGVFKSADPLVVGLVLVAGSVIASWSIINSGILKPRTVMEGALGLFATSAVIGMWVSYDYRLSFGTLIAVICSVALYFCVANFVVSANAAKYVLVIAAGLLAFYFISQFGYLDYQDEAGIFASLGRAVGESLPNLVFFRPHPNAVATFLEGGFLLSLVLAAQATRWRRFFWGSITLLIICGLLLSGSRGAWMGLLAALGLGGFLQASARIRTWIGATTGLIAGSVIAVGVTFAVTTDNSSSIFSSVREAAESRLMLYENSLYLLKDYLFTGLGLGQAFAMVYSRYLLLISVPYLYYAHNLFLSVWLGQGILGVIALVSLLVAFFYFVVEVEKTKMLTATPLVLFRAAWLGVTVSLIHGFIDSAQFSGEVWTMPVLFVLLGITVVATGSQVLKETQRTQRHERVHSYRYRWIQRAVIAILLIGVVAVWWRPIAAIWHLNLGAVYQTHADLSPQLRQSDQEIQNEKAEIHFQRSLTMNPAQFVAHKRQGLLELQRNAFDSAVYHLEQAYAEEPANQANLKALGYAYLWTGRSDAAEAFFVQVDFRKRLVEELDYWRWWWGTQQRDDLAQNAAEMARRLRK